MAKHLQKKKTIDTAKLKSAVSGTAERLSENAKALLAAGQNAEARHSKSSLAVQERLGSIKDGVEDFINLPPERIEMINLPLLSSARKTDYLITLLGAAVLAVLLSARLSGWSELLYLLPYGLLSSTVYTVIVRNARSKRFLPEFITATVASLILLAVRKEAAACFVMLALRVVMHAEGWSLQKCRDRAAWMKALIPAVVSLETPTGSISVRPQEVHNDEIIICGEGTLIPLDGILEEGSAKLDLSPLTGTESLKPVRAGDKVLSGSRNLEGSIRVRVSGNFESSTAARICALAEDTSFVRSADEAKIAKINTVAVPAAVALAFAIGVVVPVFTGAWVQQLSRAATVLALANLSALAVSVFSGYCWSVSGLLQNGVQVRCAGCLSEIAAAEAIVLDREGVLTEGRETVAGVWSSGLSKDGILSVAATIGRAATDPELRSLKTEGKEASVPVTVVEELPGLGVTAEAGSKTIIMGSAAYLESKGIEVHETDGKQRCVHIAERENYLGCVMLEDKLRGNLFEIMDELRSNGLGKSVLLSEAPISAVRKLATKLGFELMKTEMDADGKADSLNQLARTKNPGSTVMYVSANCEKALTEADIGIVFGFADSSVSPETADVLIYDNEMRRIPMLVNTAHKTAGCSRQNILAGLCAKAVLVVAATFGVLGVIPVVIADCVLSVALFANIYRLFRAPELREYESI